MTEADDALRGVLRDLIPDYTGPEDPLPRVAASVRRRRIRQRTMLAVGSTGVAAVVALGAPAVLAGGAGPAGISAAAPSSLPDGPGPRSEPAAQPVAQGSVDGLDWAIGSVALETGSQHCLFSDDALFHRQTTCFEAWKPGAPVTWLDQRFAGPGPAVTRVTGVGPAAAAQLRVRFADGTVAMTPGVRTATDRSARFFGLVVTGQRTVSDVTALNARGTPVGPPVSAPGLPPCQPTTTAACADPPK
jgi:hypothetical protein